VSTHQRILATVDELLKGPASTWKKSLSEVCKYLQKSIPHFNWVGFYFANHATQTLHLKAFAGLPTDHKEIPFGKGICGQVALSNQNFQVPDVQQQDNYIACDLHVKSELVVPLFVEGQNVGQIDIDSNLLDPFDESDERLLEAVNKKVAAYIPNKLYTLL
jgi:GAF domain-containing protein